MWEMRDGLLIDPQELSAKLGEPGLRVLDATVHLRREHPRGPYTVQSARDEYERGHIPGSAYADVAGALSDPASANPLVVPDPKRFARAAEISASPPPATSSRIRSTRRCGRRACGGCCAISASIE